METKQEWTTVNIIGVPSDLGANTRGANIGPSALRISGIYQKIKSLGYEVEDSGDLKVPVRETLSDVDAQQHYLPQIVQIAKSLCDEVYNSLKERKLPIILGGEHSLAIGSIAGSAKYLGQRNQKLGLIWVDAHADINTPQTSQTQNIHGMPLAAIIGQGFQEFLALGHDSIKVDPKNIALIGIRMLDGPERDLLKKSGIRYYTMREIDERGMATVMREAIGVVQAGTDGIHVSFDLDGVDPLYAPGVSTPVTGGLSYREAHLALEMVADTKKLVALDIVELNPTNDVEHKTALFATELIQSALGKSIV